MRLAAKMASIGRAAVTHREDGYHVSIAVAGKKPLVQLMTSNGQRVSPIGESHIGAGTVVDVELLRGPEWI